MFFMTNDLHRALDFKTVKLDDVACLYDNWAKNILIDDVTWAILPYVEGQYGN